MPASAFLKCIAYSTLIFRKCLASHLKSSKMLIVVLPEDMARNAGMRSKSRSFQRSLPHIYSESLHTCLKITMSRSDRQRTRFDRMSIHQRVVTTTSAALHPEGGKEDIDSFYYRHFSRLDDEEQMGNETSRADPGKSSPQSKWKTHRRQRHLTTDTIPDLKESFDSVYSESDDESKKQEESCRISSSKRPSRAACWGGWIVDAVPFIFSHKQPLLVVDGSMSDDADFFGLAEPLSPKEAQLDPKEVMLNRLSKEGARLESQGRLDVALECYERYLKLTETFDKKAGHGHYLVGVVRWKRGEYEESLHNLSEALQIFKEAVLNGDTTLALHNDIIDVMLAMSKTYLSQGHRRLARKCSKRALHFLGTGDDVRDGPKSKLTRAKVLHSLGVIDKDSGNFKGSMRNFHEALSLQREILGRYHVDIAATLLSFGSLCEKLGRYPESQSYYLEAFEIYQLQNENTSSTSDMGVTLTSIGWIRYLSSDFDGALRVYQNAVAYLRLTLGSNHRNVASVLIQTGMVHFQQGNLKQALQVYNEALQIQREALGDNHEDVALSLSHIGSTLEGLGDFENALECVSHSLRIYTTLFGSQHLQVALTLVHLAGVYDQMDDTSLSVACYMEASIVYKANGVEKHYDRVLLIESALQELNQGIRSN
jgi:tetratricopeptide (TPR) repeat protein